MSAKPVDLEKSVDILTRISSWDLEYWLFFFVVFGFLGYQFIKLVLKWLEKEFERFDEGIRNNFNALDEELNNMITEVEKNVEEKIKHLDTIHQQKIEEVNNANKIYKDKIKNAMVVIDDTCAERFDELKELKNDHKNQKERLDRLSSDHKIFGVKHTALEKEVCEIKTTVKDLAPVIMEMAGKVPTIVTMIQSVEKQLQSFKEEVRNVKQGD